MSSRIKEEKFQAFINSTDGIQIKRNYIKWVCLTLVILPILATVDVWKRELSLYFVIIPWIIYCLMNISYWLINFTVKQDKIKDFAGIGIIGLSCSLLCVCLEVVFSYEENIFLLIMYFLGLWIVQSILIIGGIFYNIYFDKYEKEARWKHIPFRLNIFTIILFLVCSVKIVFPFVWVGAQIFFDVFKLFYDSHITMISALLLIEFFSGFSWKLLLKGIILKKLIK